MQEEEGPRPQNRFQPTVIDRWGVAELRAYIAELQEEIGRAEREIAKRDAHAESLRAFLKKQ